jgi:hypothetical protein
MNKTKKKKTPHAHSQHSLETLAIQSLRKGDHVEQKISRPLKQGYSLGIYQAR